MIRTYVYLDLNNIENNGKMEDYLIKTENIKPIGIENIDHVRIDEIKILDKERIRTTTGKNVDELMESIKELGLFHPILINREYKLIAGYRRIKACKNLGWDTIPAIIRNDTNELEETSIELQENLRRKNLAPYEVDIALAKWKNIYEKLFPETKHLAHLKRREKKDNDNSTKFINEENIENQNEINTERFTKVASDVTNISERSIRDRVQVGDAILNKQYNNDTIKMYKNGRLTRSKMLEIDRARRKGIKSSKKENNKNPIGIGNSNNLKQNFCKTCNKAKFSTCVECGKPIIICDKGYFVLKKIDSLACKDYNS